MKVLFNDWACTFFILITLLTGCNSGEDPEPLPEPPTNLIATATSESQIDLSWEDNSNNETGFRIERKSDSESYKLLATLEADFTSFSNSTLEQNTEYTYRVYAFNSTHNTGVYSNEASDITFKALTVSDIDGNVYLAVSIGSQIWMAENLKTSRLKDGSEIPLVSDDSEWNKLTTPGYSWYDNQAENGDTYGALYNWYSVETGNLCPSGWHVPTTEEWDLLEEFLGGESVAGGKLKEAGTQHWLSPNTGATNAFNFTALPGGYHNSTGSYNLIGAFGRWWTSSEAGSGVSWYRFIGYDSGALDSRNNTKNSGFSIRCIMDQSSENSLSKFR